MITAKNIEGAWFLACQDCIKNGYQYKIDRGSFPGHERKQLPHLAMKITSPWTRPLAIFWKGQAISADAQIEDYFVNYLMNPEKQENEEYTYGGRIAPYLPYIIDMLIHSPGTNQATIEVGKRKKKEK